MSLRRVTGFGLIVLGAVSLLTVALPAAPEASKKTPLDAVRGVWRGDISDTQAFVLRFEKDAVEWKIESNGQQMPVYQGKLSFPKEHADRHMDWTELKSGGQPAPDNLCLYRVSGDTLLIIGGGGKDQPARFYTGPGGEPRTIVFTRVPAVKPK